MKNPEKRVSMLSAMPFDVVDECYGEYVDEDRVSYLK
jgi:hypothetical protein